MNIEEIEIAFNENSLKSYKVVELQEMYKVLYGIKCKAKSKAIIINAIVEHFRVVRRVSDMRV